MGPAKIADQLHDLHPTQISVIHREAKMGLGTAYVTGFNWSIEHGAECVIQMDSDFSHSPSYLPALLRSWIGMTWWLARDTFRAASSIRAGALPLPTEQMGEQHLGCADPGVGGAGRNSWFQVLEPPCARARLA